MEINEYAAHFIYPIGAKVKIKECHKMPEIVGKTGAVTGWCDKEKMGYPLMVVLDEPVFIPIAQLGGGLAVPYQGPHFCRPEELESADIKLLDIPDAFKNWELPPNQDK
jgi:hypothetical protein